MKRNRIRRKSEAREGGSLLFALGRQKQAVCFETSRRGGLRSRSRAYRVAKDAQPVAGK